MDVLANPKLITEPLLIWFRKTNRDLPWRRSYDPYHVWISEIMLQQTQMDRGVEYFLRWTKRFPDVAAVAAAGDQEILKYWEGLGYYARARNLHKAAKEILVENSGEVPCDYEQLLKLPGIGPYTAAAIASVAGNQDVAVIDANVSRVYARLFDISDSVKKTTGRKKIATIADRLLPKGLARAYNQALMDLGGLVCTPKSPQCMICPIAQNCMALDAQTVALRPVLAPKKKIVVEERVSALIVHKDKIYIQQRPQKGVWGGLWEFPGGLITESDERHRKQRERKEQNIVDLIFKNCGLTVSVVKKLTTVIHQYTHHKIILHSFLCCLEGRKSLPRLTSAVDYCWQYPDKLGQYGFPAGPRKILEYIRKDEPEILKSISTVSSP